MVSVMHLDACPTELSLERFVSVTHGDAAGTASATDREATEIETHLTRCDACRERVRVLRAADGTLRVSR